MRDVLDGILGGIMHDTWSNQLSDESLEFGPRTDIQNTIAIFHFSVVMGREWTTTDLFSRVAIRWFQALIEQLRLSNGQMVFDEPIVTTFA